MKIIPGLWHRAVTVKSEGRGQVLVLTALMLMVLILFAGLAVDVGIILDARRELVTIADAAALAGAGALSSGQAGEANDWVRQQRAVARVREYAELNGFDPDLTGNSLDIEVTFAGRKLVTVNATRAVPLAFMRLVGINEATVRAAATGRQAEAPPVDIVLVQDLSASQCFGSYAPKPAFQDCEYIVNPGSPSNADNARLDAYDPTLATKLSVGYRWISGNPGCLRHATTDTWESCSLSAHSGHSSDINQPWEPFSTQQTAARYFVSQLDARYDQVGVVGFSSAPQGTRPSSDGPEPYGTDYNARLWAGLSQNMSTVLDAIGNSPLTEGQGDEGLYPGGNTNMAAGIQVAVAELTTTPGRARENAVPVIILLSDGSPTTLLNGTRTSDCWNNIASCSEERSATMAQAQAAAQKGVLIYTVFVGVLEDDVSQALMLQYIADLTDNQRLEGSYGSLVSSGGPAYNAAWFQQNISQNYFLASNQTQLQLAYDRILEMIYTRLVR